MCYRFRTTHCLAHLAYQHMASSYGHTYRMVYTVKPVLMTTWMQRPPRCTGQRLRSRSTTHWNIWSLDSRTTTTATIPRPFRPICMLCYLVWRPETLGVANDNGLITRSGRPRVPQTACSLQNRWRKRFLAYIVPCGASLGPRMNSHTFSPAASSRYGRVTQLFTKTHSIKSHVVRKVTSCRGNIALHYYCNLYKLAKIHAGRWMLVTLSRDHLYTNIGGPRVVALDRFHCTSNNTWV